MVFNLKQVFYSTARLCGANALVLNSEWRRQRLLILCYHGVSLDDEHEWSGLYLRPELFRERLRQLREAACAVLPLGEAVERLYKGDLPRRAVTITFDDGFYDFYSVAWPALREHKFPVTVYQTTYYSYYNAPVFDPMCAYLLWKARGQEFGWPEQNLPSSVLDDAAIADAARKLKANALAARLSGARKNDFLQELAARLGIDFDDLCRRRILHLMKPEEMAEVAGEGVDFELHCHRHRVYRSRERFWGELRDNAAAIQKAAGQTPRHFCYPGGFLLPEFPAWLEEFGIQSATTCHTGLATRHSNRYLLPRLLDTPGIGREEFGGWVSGLGQLAPRRQYPPAEGQLIEEEEFPYPNRTSLT